MPDSATYPWICGRRIQGQYPSQTGSKKDYPVIKLINSVVNYFICVFHQFFKGKISFSAFAVPMSPIINADHIITGFLKPKKDLGIKSAIDHTSRQKNNHRGVFMAFINI